MHSQLFTTDKYTDLQKQIKCFLNERGRLSLENTTNSTRVAGDMIQENLSANFPVFLGEHEYIEYRSQLSRKSMADFAFRDVDGICYRVDVKTHRLDTKFNMPNLTSVERITRFYEHDTNYFVVLMVVYELDDVLVRVSDVKFVPIEFIGWDCLTIGALGWGQIQIKDSKRITINPQYSRRSWMLELCDRMLESYPKQIERIVNRIEYFKTIRLQWEQRD